MAKKHRQKRKGIGLIAALSVAALSIVLWSMGTRTFNSQAYPRKYSDFIERYSAENDIPTSLTYAVVRTESSFRPDVTSSIGAKGLMQITDETLDWIRFRMGETGEVPYDILYDAEENIRYGTFLLKTLIDEFETVETALCAYHAGWGNVKEWLQNGEYSSDGVNIENIPFADTRHYVKKVIHTMNIYKKLYS